MIVNHKTYNMKRILLYTPLILMLGTLFLISCKKQELEQGMTESLSFSGKKNTPDFVFYALTDNNMLEKINASDPEMPVYSKPITGLQAGETLLSIDFRPSTGQLYGVGSSSRIYVINVMTAAARPVGTASFTPALSGNLVGFDFNPTVDRIRLVTSTGQNLRLNPETGAVAAIDGNINGAPGAMITGSAYTNNVAGASTTTLYNIDIASRKLYRQDPPNAGTLVEVDTLNVRVMGNGGFDISPDGMAVALYQVTNRATLFTIDLQTAKTSIIHKYDKDKNYTGLAIPTNPVAYTSTSNMLMIFNPMSSAAAVSKMVTGMQTGETVLGIDFRPSNGQIYALGSNSRIYTLNASSGAAAFVATLSTPLSGTSFGFDFNPLVDRIRIVSNSGQNLRFNPADNTLIVDGAINPAGRMVSAAAYTNNFAGTTSTTLFDLDASSGKLYRQDPPNAGTLVEIGSLGVSFNDANGFDIGSVSNNAWAVLTTGAGTALYQVNTSTGIATMKTALSSPVTGFTIGLGF